MSVSLRLALILLLLLVLLPEKGYCFGAGSIPSFAYLHDRAFRHGDIENILANLAKTTHRHTGEDGGLTAIAYTLMTKGLGTVFNGDAAARFSQSDVKKVYFGNWLRDYSQAMDVGGLSKMTAETLIIIVQTLGFMTFGFATREFHITPERLGVYLPVEHIDNPKGYAKGEGDARRLHPKLRPPVVPEELEIDERNGMKRYMASEGHSWDTSTAHIRRILRSCIEKGRKAHGEECDDMWDSFRLLGAALHTLEDLLAHSNWCEISLRKLGHADVFCHVGDDVLVRSPTGVAPPLVTGTFGSADFVHSILGEASDHLAQASVEDLSQKIDQAESSNCIGSLKSLLSGLPSLLNPAEKVQSTDNIEERAKVYHFDPNAYAPEEVQALLWDVLVWRDDIVRGIIWGIERIPGLSALLEQVVDLVNQCVYTLLAPALIPIITDVTAALQEQSLEIIDTDDQYEVFDNPKASDPSHSMLAKDHVDLILNEPAGIVAQLVVEHTVSLVVHAWYHHGDPDHVVDQVLEAFHHPYYSASHSKIQKKMLEYMQSWLEDKSESEREQILASLTKESVREGNNKRFAGSSSETDDTMSSLEGSEESYNTFGREEKGNRDSDSDRRKRQLQHDNRVRGGYKAALANPNVSLAAKQRAREKLAEEGWEASSAVVSTAGADVDSDEEYLSDEGSGSQFSEYDDAESGGEWDTSESPGPSTEDQPAPRRRHRGNEDEEDYVPSSGSDEDDEEDDGKYEEGGSKDHPRHYMHRLTNQQRRKREDNEDVF